MYSSNLYLVLLMINFQPKNQPTKQTILLLMLPVNALHATTQCRVGQLNKQQVQIHTHPVMNQLKWLRSCFCIWFITMVNSSEMLYKRRVTFSWPSTSTHHFFRVTICSHGLMLTRITQQWRNTKTRTSYQNQNDRASVPVLPIRWICRPQRIFVVR